MELLWFAIGVLVGIGITIGAAMLFSMGMAAAEKKTKRADLSNRNEG